MNRDVLRRLRDLIPPIELPERPAVASDYNAALATFRELVDTILAAEQARVHLQVDMEAVLGMYGDLLVERDEILRMVRGPTRGS